MMNEDETNANVDDDEGSDGPVTTEVSIGEKSTDQRSGVTCSRPICDTVGSCYVSHTQMFLYIVHQVCTHSIVRQSFTTLRYCPPTKFYSNQ